MLKALLLSCLLVSTLIGGNESQSLNSHDGSTAPPRLMIVQAMWGMIGYPSKEAEWGLEALAEKRETRG